MKKIRAHFNGEVIVPDEPVDLPKDLEFIVRIELPDEVIPSKEEVREITEKTRKALRKWMEENPY